MDILNRMTVTFLLIISFSFCYLNAQNPKVKFSISHCNDINGQVAPFEVIEICPSSGGGQIFRLFKKNIQAETQ